MGKQWKVNGSESTTAIWVEDETGKRVCTVRNCDDDSDLAALIAAAPDLLQALEAIMADYDAWQKGDIENPMAIVNEEKAIAAIKQAKGE